MKAHCPTAGLRPTPRSARRFPAGKLALLGIALSFAACDDAIPPLNPIEGSHARSPVGQGNGQFVSVMTRNLYIGTDIANVLGAAPAQVPIAVGTAYAEVVASLPAERMAAIAAEIADNRPDVVGLQEVSTFYIQAPGDFLAGNAVQATSLQYDFLALLLQELAARGAVYEVAAVSQNLDLEVPGFSPQLGLFDVRIQDRGVILVRDGVKYKNGRSGVYSTFLPVSIGGFPVQLRRGWTAVEAKVRGSDMQFFNTHLETQAAVPVNVAQGMELLALTSQATLPVVLMGDFNSAANPSASAHRKTPTYGNIIDAGFTDVWSSANPGNDGASCCHAADLLNDVPEFDQRIDLIFHSGEFVFGAQDARLLGEETADRTPSLRWPSDHAGVFGRVRMP